jgi:N,N'-diacetyllegionaminate synthase
MSKGEKIVTMKHSQLFFIAEAGVNHNGSTDMAIELVWAAKRAGADAVKFQTFKAKDVAARNAPKALYQLQTTDNSESQIDMLKALELPDDAWSRIVSACTDAGILFLSTPYGTGDIDLLERLGVVAYKVASGQIVEPFFLRQVARTGKPVLLSTGMATLAEIDRAVETIEMARSEARIVTESNIFPPLTLLQCTTDYPASIEDANLAAIPTMAAAFGLPVGYSDHTEDVLASIVAAALGARVFEKHFTLDRGLPGPDQSSSIEPDQFAEYVTSLKRAVTALGSSRKFPSDREKRNLPNMRRGCVALRDLPSGTVLTERDIGFRRPMRGVVAADVDLLIGRRLDTDVPAGAFFDFVPSSLNVEHQL